MEIIEVVDMGTVEVMETITAKSERLFWSP
jgi:hypothetical protein